MVFTKYDIQDGKDTDIVIVLMGPTGAGKSTFLNCVLGREFMKVSHFLSSCTHRPSAVAIDPFVLGVKNLRNRRLVLLDTPGFDDTFRDDVTILKEIADWLGKSYRNKTRIGGVLYLHDITAARLTGSARKNLEMFSLMCGDAIMSKTVLVTTKCDLVSLETLERREADMKSICWDTMTKSGAKMLRFHGDSESALKILQDILQRENLRHGSLQIQMELIDDRKRVPETAAGRELRYTLKQFYEMQKETERLEKKFAEKGDPELQEKLAATQEKMLALQEQIQDLQISLSRRFLGFFRFLTSSDKSRNRIF